MSSEYSGPPQDPNRDASTNNRRPTSELWGPWEARLDPDEDTQPRPAVSKPTPSSPPAATGNQPEGQASFPADPQFVHREHVTGALPFSPSDAPLFRPAYWPYPPNAPAQGHSFPAPPAPQQPLGYPPTPMQYRPEPGYQPYAPAGYPQQGQAAPDYRHYPAPAYPPGYAPHPGLPAYNSYPYPYPYAYPYPYVYPPYAWAPPRPKRDGYRLGVIITALVCSALVLLAGLASTGFLFLLVILPHNTITQTQYFSSLMTFTGFALAGLVGGAFSLYHSIRGLINKPSASFKLPWFWIFVVLYLVVVVVGYILQVKGFAVTYPALTIFLIILAAIFPALALLAFGVRRLRFPSWPTTWRRFTLALTSGATLGIGLALILELAALLVIVRTQGVLNFQQCFDNPSAPGCGSFSTFDVILLIVGIVGPLVEETVKPLGVAFFIGRMRGAAEAFVLGLGAGIGFALVETVGYIGSGYQDWLSVALERTAAGLLHGFGTAMVALGWYYLIHAKSQRLLKAFGCWAYAVFQHFVWNTTAVLAFLPAPYGPALNNWSLNLGFVALPLLEIANIIEAILILVFFIYMTGRLKKMRLSSPPAPSDGHKEESIPKQQAVARV